MTWRQIGTALLGAIAGLALAAAPAVAIRAHAPPGARRQLDVRARERAAVPVATHAARVALARRLGIEGVVERDRVGGGIHVLGRTDGFLSGPRGGDPAGVALDYVRAHASVFGLSTSDLGALRLTRRTSTHGVTHLRWIPFSHGIPAYDSALLVHVTGDGRVIGASGPPLGGLLIPSATPRLMPGAALGIAQRDVGARMTFPAARTEPGPQRRTSFRNGDRASLVALDAPGGDRLAWRLIVAGTSPYVYDELIDAETGEVLVRHSLTDFASHLSVFPYHPGAASGGTQQSFTVTDPAWLNDTAAGMRLAGRNAHAYADVDNDDTADAGEEIAASSLPGPDWSYALQSVAPASGQTCAPWGVCSWDGADTSTESTNRAQATTQVFYDVNAYHDWLKQPAIGFDDAAGNFEVGGTGGSDPVQAEADDSALASGSDGPFFDNANMTTPPDGSPPRMQMYLFNAPFPAVNGADDASVVYHEYTHGLSNRLIGDGNGLNDNQPGAMGEGWSDWYALDFLVTNGLVSDTAADGEAVVGEYVTGDTQHGIRFQALDCPVGASSPACPGSVGAGHDGGFTFADLGWVGTSFGWPQFEVHDDGEIWSETLWDLRDALGASTARELITDAMRLSPAEPSFLDERDAILQADLADFAGAHHDAIWQVFAVRGMGHGARTSSPNATGAAPSFAPPQLAELDGASIADPGPLGDGDGVAEPGETVQLSVRLTNPGLASLTNVSATLTSNTPGADVSSGPVGYGTIGSGATTAGGGAFTVPLTTLLTCGNQVALTLHVTSDQGSLDLPVFFGLGAGRGTFASSDVPVAIPDADVDGDPGDGAGSTLTVPTGGRIDHLRVTLQLHHTWTGDLHGWLVSPVGRVVDLFEHPGLSPDGSGFGGFAPVTFDDDAAQSIQDVAFVAGGPAISGTYQPDEPLSAVAGQSAAGTWQLVVADLAHNDVGAIDAWSIETDEPACATTAGQPGGGGGTPGAGTAPTSPPTLTPTPPSVTGTTVAKISRLTRRARLDRRHRFALTFRASPAGLRGTLRLVVARTRHARAVVLAARKPFRASSTGRVRMVLVARGAALRRVLALKRARVAVTIRYGGRTFRTTLTLLAPRPRPARR